MSRKWRNWYWNEVGNVGVSGYFNFSDCFMIVVDAVCDLALSVIRPGLKALSTAHP